MKSKFDLNLTPVQHEEIIKRGTMEIDGIQYNTNFYNERKVLITAVKDGEKLKNSDMVDLGKLPSQVERYRNRLTSTINVKVHPDLYDRLIKEAETAGLSLSSYIREKLSR